MSLLKRYLKIRGVRISDLAKAVGMNPHRIYKTVEQYREPPVADDKKHRNPVVRKAVSDYLGLDYQEVWGDLSEYSLRLLIWIEIDRILKDRRADLVREFLADAGKDYQGQVLPAMTKWQECLEGKP